MELDEVYAVEQVEEPQPEPKWEARSSNSAKSSFGFLAIREATAYSKYPLFCGLA